MAVGCRLISGVKLGSTLIFLLNDQVLKLQQTTDLGQHQILLPKYNFLPVLHKLTVIGNELHNYDHHNDIIIYKINDVKNNYLEYTYFRLFLLFRPKHMLKLVSGATSNISTAHHKMHDSKYLATNRDI